MTRPTSSHRIATAQAAFEAGFLSMAAKKRALDELNRAYRNEYDLLMVAILKACTPENADENSADYWGGASELHQVRDRHLDIFKRYGFDTQLITDLLALRAAIKDAEIAPAPAKPEIEVRAEKVRKSIIEEMEARKAQFVEGMEIARLFNGLLVSVNAHWVHGHKGARFIRHFFYLRGTLTPLNMILAIAEAYQDEKKGA